MIIKGLANKPTPLIFLIPICLLYSIFFIRTSIDAGLFPANTLIRSSGCSYRSSRRPLHEQKPVEPPLLAHCVGWSTPLAVSASELLLDSKRPSFLASRRFAKGKPGIDAY